MEPVSDRTTTVTITEKVARLETAMFYERQMTDKDIQALWSRLHYLERRKPVAPPPPPIDTAGWIKLALAVLIPMGALIMTGSIEHAVKAARLMGGP